MTPAPGEPVAAVVSETVEAEGHLIDSGDLQAILTTIVEHGAELRNPAVRRRPHQRRHASTLSITVTAGTRRVARSPARKAVALRLLRGRHCRMRCSAVPTWTAPRRTTSTPRPITAPTCGSTARGSRSTGQRMDAAIVVERRRQRSAASCATCARGDPVVCGMHGVRVLPDVQSRDKPTFGFMSNEVSSERRVETAVARVAEPDAAHQGGRRPHRVRRRARRRPYRRHGVFLRSDSRRLRRPAALGQRARRARHRVRALGHLARHRSQLRPSGRARPSQPHARDQRHPPRRRHRPGRRDRRADLGHHARVPHARRALPPRRVDPRRRAAAGDDDGSGRGAGRVRGGARRRRAW